jgi:3D-(3,5/4)-trihydroxycyclohexane-1,2-dione acylhydrolase (decyclizing)
VRRPPPEADPLARAAAAIRDARRPLIVAGGGVRYSEAWDALRALAEATGIPVAETQAGKGALPYDHPSALGAVGATGTRAANLIARDADLVLGVGTRFTDFTTASRTAFQAPGLRVIGLNVAPMDAFKLGALPLVADARAGLEALAGTLEGFRVDAEYAEHAARLNREWDEEVGRLYAGDGGPGLTQAEVIGVVNAAARPEDVVVCAAGSLPGDLHKLWRTRDPRGYHLEYGFSTMGYEVAGGLGVKLADPGREVFVMVGDGSWLMMSSEIATSIQEDVRLTVVLIDNGGFASIGGLSRSVGSDGFGTAYRARDAGGGLTGARLELDLAANARSLGAIGVRAESRQGLADALEAARTADRTTVVVVACDPARGVPAYEAWWDVAVAEVAEMPAVREARTAYEAARRRQRPLLGGDDGD